MNNIKVNNWKCTMSYIVGLGFKSVQTKHAINKKIQPLKMLLARKKSPIP